MRRRMVLAVLVLAGCGVDVVRSWSATGWRRCNIELERTVERCELPSIIGAGGDGEAAAACKREALREREACVDAVSQLSP